MTVTQRTSSDPDIRRHVSLDPSVIEYPESDGAPMAESDLQYRCIVDTRFALEQYFRANPDVYVGADLLVYYDEGDPAQRVAPDVLVALGVPKRIRRRYLTWEEGKAPDVVFEFASPGTWRADASWKRGLYQGLGVREYFLFDPAAEFLNPALQGYCLVEGAYAPAPPLATDRAERGLASDVLGLELWMQRSEVAGMPFVLRLLDPAASNWLHTPEQAAEAQRQAETRIAELEAELQRLRGTG